MNFLEINFLEVNFLEVNFLEINFLGVTIEGKRKRETVGFGAYSEPAVFLKYI